MSSQSQPLICFFRGAKFWQDGHEDWLPQMETQRSGLLFSVEINVSMWCSSAGWGLFLSTLPSPPRGRRPSKACVWSGHHWRWCVAEIIATKCSQLSNGGASPHEKYVGKNSYSYHPSQITYSFSYPGKGQVLGRQRGSVRFHSWESPQKNEGVFIPHNNVHHV